MTLFSSMFGKKEKKEVKPTYVNWIPLTDMKQLEEIKKTSIKEPIAIFKHSTRCGISSMVINRFQESFTEDMKHIKVYYLDLLSYRNISDEVGYTFQVMHQSPQLLIIKNGEAVAHASHYTINQLPLNNYWK